MMKSVIEPNLTCRELGQLRRGAYLLRVKGSPEQCLYGHIAYGWHRFQSEPVDYATMLREPVDRAVSFYYWRRGGPRVDIWERHPLRDYFNSVSLGEAFENPKFSNIQTRRLAGIEFDHAYPYVSRCRRFRRAMLAAAIKHLVAMPVFGLQERFEESQQRFLNYIGGGTCISGLHHGGTRSERLTLAELAELRPSLLRQLRTANDLDAELYEFAAARFARLPPSRVERAAAVAE